MEAFDNMNLRSRWLENNTCDLDIPILILVEEKGGADPWKSCDLLLDGSLS